MGLPLFGEEQALNMRRKDIKITEKTFFKKNPPEKHTYFASIIPNICNTLAVTGQCSEIIHLKVNLVNFLLAGQK